MAGSTVAVDDRSSLIDAINRYKYRDSGNPRFPAQVIWTASGSTYPLTLAGPSTNHLAILLSGTSPTAVPSPANAVLLVQDAAVSIGAGKELRFYNVAGTNDCNLIHSGTNDILYLNDSFWVAVALGVGVTPGALGPGEVLAAGNLAFKSGTAFVITFDHAATAARTVTFQDLAGVVALLGVANAGGHLLFVDNTYDIGAPGATRPRNLYLAGAIVADGTITGTTQKARVYNSANISVAHAAYQSLTFNSERWDNDTIHDTATNPGRLTCKTAGLYTISGHLQFDASATGSRGCRIVWNNALSVANHFGTNTGAAIGTMLSISTQWQMAVNDYVELQAYQDSGAALNVLAGPASSPEFAMARIG